MSGKTLRILLIAVLVLVAFTAVMGSVSAQGTTPTATATLAATPRTLPGTGGAVTPASTATVVLLALGATAGLGGLLLRGLRQPR